MALLGERNWWMPGSLVATGGGLGLLAAGAAVTCSVALATIWIGHRVLRLPFALVGGMLAAVQTQPAVLGFAVEQARSDFPNLAYARAYPLALVLKILLAQILLEVLAR